MTDPAGRETILLLGDPRLRAVCAPVADFSDPDFQRNGRRLLRALEQFRAEYGFGRAISAPQIGIAERMIAMNLGEGPFLIVNPELDFHSADSFSLWDDCMSFPWLMIRLRRRRHASLNYLDETGKPKTWRHVDPAVSELLQHEVDHLNGILAVDHAIDRDSIIARSEYERQKDHFDGLVDYFIRPTIRGNRDSSG